MDSMNMQPMPPAQKKGSGKAIFLIIGLAVGVVFTALVMCIAHKMISEKTPKTMEGEGYDSPEEAVEAYLNFLKEGNLEGVISTFAVESYADNYDMEEGYKRARQFSAFSQIGGQMTTGLYFDSDMSRDFNIESRRAFIIYSLHKQLLEIALQNTDEEEIADAVNDMILYRFEDEDEAEDIMDFLSTDLELDSIDIDNYLDERDFDVPDEMLKRERKSLEKCWGSDVESVMVEVEIADEDYMLFALCVCYDGKWYIADFNNPIAYSLGLSLAYRGLVPKEEIPGY